MRIKVLSGGRKNIELPLSDAELNFQMRRIGIEETVPICRLVEVSEQDNPLHKFEGQTVNMDEVNFFAKRMKSMTEYERKVLSAYAEDYGVATMQDLINLTFSMKGLSLLTDFSDARQVGERLYLDEFLGISEEEKAQTNFIEFAEKTLKESRVEVLPYGVFVEHGFEMQEVYNGKTFPSFVASDETVAIVELQNKAGDTEYLYLPTDISSMNKVKERLQVQDYWEMEVTGIENLRLPDILVPMPENIDCVEALTLFNETCQAVKRFDEVQMTQLAMVVEFTGFSSSTEVTSIARLLGEFEVNPFVHNDEEYGKYMVEESGLFDVDELLLPHINYAAFAADKRQGTLVQSGYVENGFVGATRELSEYQQYNGEFADPLEIDEDCYETFKLYSPLTGNLFEGGCERGNLYRSDLTPYAEEIAETIENEYCVGEEPRGLMHYFDRSLVVAAKVMSAYPKVEIVDGEVYGVLECKVSIMNGGIHRMSKKNMESTRELMGTKEVTNYSVRTYRNDELVYFLIQPSNISVLSQESLSARIYGLMTVLKGITEIEMMCLNSRENFEDNKRYLKKRMEEETNPAVRKLLEKDANYLDRMQVQMATAREFLLIIRIRNQKENEIFSYLNRIEKMLVEQGFKSKRAEEEDIRRILAVYFEQNVTTEKFEEFDGERWIILNE